jgi:hypothetical protein
MGNLAKGGVGTSGSSKGEKPPATPTVGQRIPTPTAKPVFTTGGNTGMTQAAPGMAVAQVMPSTGPRSPFQIGGSTSTPYGPPIGTPGGLQPNIPVARSPFAIGGQTGTPAANSPAGPGSTAGNPQASSGWAPKGSSYTGPNGSVVIPGMTFVPTGVMPGQGRYIPTNSPEAQQLQAQQYQKQALANAGQFTIGGQKPTAPPAPPVQAGYSQTNSGDTQGAASVPAVPNPYNPSAYSNTNYVQPSQGQDSKGGIPPYDPYYNDSTAWGGSSNSGLYSGGRSPLIEALNRRNQAPEARYYG